MKSSMKKLAVFVMIAAIAMFAAATTASAFDRDDHRNAIVGEYGFAGGGTCITTPATNWVGDFTLTDPTKVSASSYNAHGIVTFEPKGKGTINFMVVGTPIPPAWSPTWALVSYPFTYTVTGDGEINFAAVPNTFTQTSLTPLSAPPGTPTGVVVYRDNYSLTGYVSADHKTITLATPAPEIDTFTVKLNGTTIATLKATCHDSHTLIRLDE